MRRCSHALLLLTFVLLATTGCGDDSTTAPSGSASFSIAELFTPEEAVVTELETETNLRMVGVQFGATSAELTEASFPVLDKFRRVFAEFPDASYSVEGHTDERGSASYNQRISRDRAASVRSYLIDEVGGSASAIDFVGYGETRPLDPSSTAAAWALNRRIEIIVRYPN